MTDVTYGGVVLVVEDDAAIRKLVSETLRLAGFGCVESADGESAVGLALEHAPDAILLDVGLPGIHGLAVLERLKAHPALANTPVIIVSAWGGREWVDRALAAGATGYVRKPFEIRQLVRGVQAAVRPGGPAVAA